MLREVSRRIAMRRKTAIRKKAESVTQQPPPAFAAAFTVAEFCRAHRMSETHYYELKKNGQGPDEMEVGRRRIVSIEAAARWRKARETAAAEAAE
jgi:hypothetical protein